MPSDQPTRRMWLTIIAGVMLLGVYGGAYWMLLNRDRVVTLKLLHQVES